MLAAETWKALRDTEAEKNDSWTDTVAASVCIEHRSPRLLRVLLLNCLVDVSSSLSENTFAACYPREVDSH